MNMFDARGVFNWVENMLSDDEGEYGGVRMKTRTLHEGSSKKSGKRKRVYGSKRGAELKEELKKAFKTDPFANSYDIVPVRTNKNKIYQRPAMERGVIPKHPFRLMANGESGSGKSTVILNLLMMSKFYGPDEETGEPYFDEIVIYAPTAGRDDMLDTLVNFLDIPEENINSVLDPDHLRADLNKNKKIIEEKGIENSPRKLYYMEDVISRPDFIKSEAFKEIAVAGRHNNESIIICTQSFTSIPRAVRLQMSAIIYFEGSESELQIITEEYQPPGAVKKEFRRAVAQLTAPSHQFLFILRTEPPERRYRKNFSTILPSFGKFDQEESLENNESSSETDEYD